MIDQYRHRRAMLTSILSLVVLATLWFACAPVQIGGQTTYIIVRGNSMEPLYHSSDLVVLRVASRYDEGDIVAYRHPDIGLVIHRIIGHTADQLIVKGDHNAFVDTYRPRVAEIVGKAWFYVPLAGQRLAWLHHPIVIALLVLGAICLGGHSMLQTNNRHDRQSRSPRRRQTSLSPAISTIREFAFGICALLALTSLVLAIWFFMRPTTRDLYRDLTYQQAGAFRYSVTAPPGIYDPTGIVAGEPIYRKVSNTVHISFAYHISGDTLSGTQGSCRLLVELSALDGWKRTFELQPQQTFVGNSFTAYGTIKLDDIQALINQLEHQTLLDRSQYQLTIKPEVVIAGTLAGHTLHDTFAPKLNFLLDDLQLQLVTNTDGSDTLQPQMSGVIKQQDSEPNTVVLLGITFTVADIRRWAVLGLGLGLLSMAVLSLPLVWTIKRDKVACIKLRYGALLIEAVETASSVNDTPVAQVATIEDLVRLAEKRNTTILHEQHNKIHFYRVHDGALWYSYQTSSTADSKENALPSNAAENGAEHWQPTFLKALRETGSPAEACRQSGTRLVLAYQERERVPAFALAWKRARAEAAVQHPIFKDASW